MSEFIAGSSASDFFLPWKRCRGTCPPSRENVSYIMRPILMRAAPRSRGFPRPWVTSRRNGAERIPENVEKIGIVVSSGRT